MNEFSAKYRSDIEASLGAFVRNGDDVAALGYFVFQHGNCQMCGHTPIKWHYILENLQSHSHLVVGSECIQNYQVILSEWGYRPEFIYFPIFLQPFVKWVLDKNPKAIRFDDSAVLGFRSDCGAVLRTYGDPSQMDNYGYIKRAVVSGREIAVTTSKLGEETPLLLEDMTF